MVATAHATATWKRSVDAHGRNCACDEDDDGNDVETCECVVDDDDHDDDADNIISTIIAGDSKPQFLSQNP